MPARRRKAREFALKALYQSAAHASASEKGPPGGLVPFADSFFGPAEYKEKEREYGLGILRDFERRREEIDQTIRDCSQNWKWERISLVDLSIMRIAVLELFCRPDVPGKAAINEALELAREFSGEDSVRFINGILDKVFQESQKKASAQPPA